MSMRAWCGGTSLSWRRIYARPAFAFLIGWWACGGLSTSSRRPRRVLALYALARAPRERGHETAHHPGDLNARPGHACGVRGGARRGHTEPVRVAGDLRSPRRNEFEERGSAEILRGNIPPAGCARQRARRQGEDSGEEGEDKVEKKRTCFVGGRCMNAPVYVLVALLHRALARYTSITARASQTRGHDGAPPSAPNRLCPPTSRARHPRRCGPRPGQAVRAASEHVHHAGTRSRSAPAQRSCAETLHCCAHASACAEGSREWRTGEGRGDTGRTYILRRREVYSVCARPRSWNTPASAQGHARTLAA
jgi:hypothetical protein